MSAPDSSRGVSRRQVIALGAGLFTVALVPAALRRGRGKLVTRSIPVMGTIAEVAVVHPDIGTAETAIDAAFERLRWVDRTMSRYEATSDVGRINATAAHDAVTVHPATAFVIGEALRWAEASEGEFDPGLARMIEVWDVGHRQAPPPANAFHRLAGRSLYRAVTVDRFDGSPVVRLDDRDAGIDLGGIAKGYAVDLAVQALRNAGIRHAVVNAGGDLYAMGRSADGDRWKVGIQLPADPSRVAETLELEDAALATSGDYLQGFDWHGRRYHHILDPVTAEPRQVTSHSITIRAARCLDADAAATAVFGMAPDRASEVLGRRQPAAEVVSRI
jgi:thiamine biosynthesis lipoprotein